MKEASKKTKNKIKKTVADRIAGELVQSPTQYVPRIVQHAVCIRKVRPVGDLRVLCSAHRGQANGRPGPVCQRYDLNPIMKASRKFT